MDDFHCGKFRPGEAISLYVHNLQKLLSHALSEAVRDMKEPLLLHLFLAGIPKITARQLRASGKVTTLEKAMTCAKLLTTIDPEPEAAVGDKNAEKPNET